MTIDLRQEQGREVFQRLVAVSDVVFDAFRPSVLDRLDIGYQSLKKINPKVIACSLSAFGQEGPYRERPGFDGIVQTMGGGMSVTGNQGQPPVFMGFPVGDMVGGYVAALSIASALYGRSITGEGRHTWTSAFWMCRSLYRAIWASSTWCPARSRSPSAQAIRPTCRSAPTRPRTARTSRSTAPARNSP